MLLFFIVDDDDSSDLSIIGLVFGYIYDDFVGLIILDQKSFYCQYNVIIV